MNVIDYWWKRAIGAETALLELTKAAKAIPASRELTYTTRDDGERTYLVGGPAMLALLAALPRN
jgi:hypothetical protein